MLKRGSEKPASKLLTEAELELMKLLWKQGEGSVNEVMDALPQGRTLAYTSVSTILRILEQKGFVASRPRNEGRGHIYTPTVEKKDYEATTIHHVVSKVFDGTPTSLVKRLIEDGKLSPEELNSIRELLK